ncbi:MAG: hypothetical protein LBI28_07715 [Treponema sp.]|jgi:hypothetical protein|nr:hypothetical protein [Treponema sp.]
MKNILFVFIGFFLLVGCASVKKEQTSTRRFEVPRNYSFVTEADFRRYEADILECIDYLESAPVDDLSNDRRRINTFFLEWLTNVPYVHIIIDGSVIELCDKNANFLITFMGGWTKHVLLHPDDQSEINGYFAGIESILAIYRKGNGVKSDEKIMGLIRIQDEGKLMDWVLRQRNQNGT